MPEEQRRKAFATIIVTQCLGMLTTALFFNGFYLNYFAKLGITSAQIAMLIALPPLLSVFLLLPFAYCSDRFGKKKMALTGQLLLLLSLLLMMAAGWGAPGGALLPAILSLVVYSIGGSLQGAGWFALLNPIIPRSIRGRFFGRLRVTFQAVSILYTVLITRMLKVSQSMTVFQILLGIVLAAAMARFFTYARIPELENTRGESGHRKSLLKALASVLSAPEYIRFNVYILLITCFTASVPTVFALMQKDVFLFTPSQITLMGLMLLVGNLIGCGLGGRLVDRYGSRFVMMITHAAYILVILAMLARHWIPWPLIVLVSVCMLLFNLLSGMAGVAITARSLALITDTNKSLSTALTVTLLYGGTACSGLFVSQMISRKMPAFEWYLAGKVFTVYDSLLLLFSVLTLCLLTAWRCGIRRMDLRA